MLNLENKMYAISLTQAPSYNKPKIKSPEPQAGIPPAYALTAPTQITSAPAPKKSEDA